MRTIFAAALALALAACGNTPDNTADADAPAAAVAATSVDFGDDSSRWANDNECDDKRFIGAGMTATPLLDEDIGHDATDCRTAFEAGRLRLAGAAAPAGGAAK